MGRRFEARRRAVWPLPIALLGAGLVAGILGGGVVGGGEARAADSSEAEALIRQGTQLRQQGHDVPALPLFQKAYDLLPTPRSAGQLGLAEMALGYWFDAEQHIDEALASPDHPWVTKNADILKQAVARVRTNIGEIVVAGSPAGASVLVNRRAAGVLPLARPVRVAKGKVDVEVSAAGFVTTVQSFQLKGGERRRVTADLAKASPAVAAAAPAPAVLPEAGAKPSAGTTGAVAVSALSPLPASNVGDGAGDGAGGAAGGAGGGGGNIGRKVGWGLGVAAGAVLVGAVVETVLWQRKRTQFGNTTGCYEDVPNRGPAGCSAIYDSARQAEQVAIIGYAATGLLAGGAMVMLLTGGTPEHQTASARSTPAPSTAMTCAPGLGSTILNCRLTF